jgi:hypothetical protein
MKWRRKTAARWALLAVIIFGVPWPGGVRTGLAVLQQPTPDPNTLIGIGAVLGGSYPSIMQIVKGGPADLDGRLKANDRIAAVAQGNGVFVDCANLAIDEVVGMVRGKKGSTVRLQIIPAGAADPTKREVIALVRARIKMRGQGIVAPPMPVILQGLFAPAPAAAVPAANAPAATPAPAAAASPAIAPSLSKPAASGTATPSSSPAR